MISRLLKIVLILMIPVIAPAQDEISVQMTLDRDTINISEQAYLTVTVTSTRQNLPTPELPNLSMFNVYSQGTSTNISIVNGQMEASYSYQYMLQPKRQGSFPIKSVAVVFNQKRYVSNELVLTVLSSGTSTPPTVKQEASSKEGDAKEIFLTADLDRKTAYVNEQLTLTVKFHYGVQLYSQPEYTAPQTTDFWTDVLDAQKSYFQIINGRRYQVIEMTSALFPTRSGELSIGPAMVTAMVAARRAPRRNDPFSVFDDFFTQTESRSARSRSLTVNILPLPAEGKPAGFTGTVGDFTITAAPDKTTADVNQPVTVTYKINGTGNIKTVAEPEIGDLQDFRTYRSSSNEKISKVGGLVGGTKIFEEVYIPKRAGRLTVPAVKLDFFNPRLKKYRSVSTAPIELEVRPISSGEVANAPMSQVAGRVVEAGAKDIRYIKTDPGGLSHPRKLILFTPLYMIINALPVALLIAVLIERRRRDRLTSDTGYARSRRAKKLARKHLSAAQRLQHQGNAGPFYAELRRALFTYVADKMNISVHGMTGEQLLEILKQVGAEEELLKRTEALLRQADFAQYSSGSISSEMISEAMHTAEDLLIKWEGFRLG